MKALRQIIQVRGERLWVIADRMETPATVQHEYTQFVSAPVRLPATGFEKRVALLAENHCPLVERDTKSGWLRTSNPDVDNVSAWFFAPQPLTVGNEMNSSRQIRLRPSLPMEELQEGVKAGKTYQQIMKVNSMNNLENKTLPAKHAK